MLLSGEFRGNRVVSNIVMSDMLDIRQFAKSMVVWDQWDIFFLAV